MLRTLRKLFEPESETAAPPAGGGKLTLRDILLRDWDELWYQPKIDLRTKRLVGAEGLVRARLPDGSIVPPGDFLPGAKEEEMLALTERVIITALRDFEDCAVQGASVKLSVNVPVSALVKLPLARMLREHELTGRVHRVAGAPEFRLPAYLCFPAKGNSESLSLALDTIRRVAAEAA